MEIQESRKRAVISSVLPEVEGGRFPIKRIIGEQVDILADIFAEGHTDVAAQILFRHGDQEPWQSVPMEYTENDRWIGRFVVKTLGFYQYVLMAWVDHFLTWQKDMQKKIRARIDPSVDLQTGITYIEEALKAQDDSGLKEWLEALKSAKSPDQAVALALDRRLHFLMRNHYPNREFITQYPALFTVIVDPPKAAFSAWYELFPRSCLGKKDTHGTFAECQKLLPDIKKMGFDTLYLPPIHPIGLSKRRGKNNQITSSEKDPGSPWAVGSKEGGHKSLHPNLGAEEDFKNLIAAATEHGIDIAMDLALQCSPDHPYLTEHPEWFLKRPDGTIQFAENPPKKYEDIIPFNFETDKWKELWEELKSIVMFWIEKGIKIFRVDNPHTKPFAFWEWLLTEIKKAHPDVIFLSEAFTRPKVMLWLAKLGFTQSYTYFTWRRTKKEIIDYVTELTSKETREYFRPSFWPNTPDILTEELQNGGRAAFIVRFLMASTLVSNYGIYGPAFEQMVTEAVKDTEEYLQSEKYEIKSWDWKKADTLKDLISLINQIRRENPALQNSTNIKFYDVDNDQILFYGKWDSRTANTLFIAVCLDPFNTHSATLTIPIMDLGINPNQSYRVQELLTDRSYIWQGEKQQITLNPEQIPAYIFRTQKLLRTEKDFDYFM